MLWKKLQEWADTVYSFVRGLGLQESVMTVDELSSGEEVAGTGSLLGVMFPGVGKCSVHDMCFCKVGLEKPCTELREQARTICSNNRWVPMIFSCERPRRGNGLACHRVAITACKSL